MTEPRYSDVDLAMTAGRIQLIGDGNQLAANLDGDRADILRDMLTDFIAVRDGKPDVEHTPEFRAGFDFARKIADPGFRAWLDSLGWESGSTIYPAVADTPI